MQIDSQTKGKSFHISHAPLYCFYFNKLIFNNLCTWNGICLYHIGTRNRVTYNRSNQEEIMKVLTSIIVVVTLALLLSTDVGDTSSMTLKSYIMPSTFAGEASPAVPDNDPISKSTISILGLGVLGILLISRKVS